MGQLGTLEFEYHLFAKEMMEHIAGQGLSILSATAQGQAQSGAFYQVPGMAGASGLALFGGAIFETEFTADTPQLALQLVWHSPVAQSPMFSVMLNGQSLELTPSPDFSSSSLLQVFDLKGAINLDQSNVLEVFLPTSETAGTLYLGQNTLASGAEITSPATALLLDYLTDAVVDAPSLGMMGVELAPNGTVEGTLQADLIDADYNDPDGDHLAISPRVVAGGGDDTLDGGADADTINGGDGSDVIYGGAGDVVDGGAGYNRLIVNGVTNIAYDPVVAGSGTVYFSWGPPLEFSNISVIIADGQVQGTGPNGIVTGTDGADVIDADYQGDPEGDRIDNNDAVNPAHGANDDVIHALNGDDLIYAGLGNDKVFAGLDHDTVYGGEGDDTIYGDGGDDVLFGGAGDDLLYGDAGNDHIYGGTGADRLYGGADRDTFYVGNGEGIGTIIDGGSTGDNWDTLDLSAWDPDRLNIIYSPDNRKNGVVQFLDEQGQPIGELTFTEIEEVIPPPCFTPGTLIATIKGEMRVEDLRLGDLVLTRDHGYQPIRWIGKRTFSVKELLQSPRLAPISIAKGALGHDLPEQDLLVSPQHRVLIADSRAELLFGEHEVLVAASHLVGRDGVYQQAFGGVTYLHIMFDDHEIVCSNGAWSESYQPGALTVSGLEDAQQQELFEIFPELKEGKTFQSARMSLRRHEAILLTA